MVTRSGEVFQVPVGGGEWTQLELPDGEDVFQIAGKGDNNPGATWAVVTNTGKVLEAPVDWQGSWVDLELPDDKAGEPEQAVQVAGDGKFGATIQGVP